MKKFIKKIGKGIKKIGKAIGKPFKKLMKTKIGKIIGTIGMMLVGGWMLGGAKAFVGGMFQGQTMGTAFSNAVSQMGTQAGAAYSSVTEAVKGMFGADPTTTSKALADSTVAGTDFATSVSDLATKGAGATGAGAGAGTSTFEQAVATTTDGSITTVGAETASGNIAGVDIRAGRIGEIAAKPKVSLLQPKGVDFATDLSSQIDPNLTLTDPKLASLDLKQPKFLERNFPKMADVFESSKTLTDVGDKFMEFKPLQDFEALPKFVRNTDLAEVQAVSSLLQKPVDPYIPGSSDMSGALASLQENSARLYGGMPMNELMSQTSVPSPVPTTTASLMNKYKQAGYIYDTTLLT